MRNYILALIAILVIGFQATTYALPSGSNVGPSGSTHLNAGTVNSSDYQSLEGVINALGTSNATIQVTTPLPVTRSTTVPSNITLQFLAGGSIPLSIDASGIVTLTINGPIIAPVQTIFSGSNLNVVINISTNSSLNSAWGSFTTTGSASYTNTFNGFSTSSTVVPTGFTRVGPHHVISSTNFALSSISIGTVCTSVNLAHFGLPSSAISTTLHMEIALNAGSAAGVQEADVTFYQNSGCTVLLGGMGLNNGEGHDFRSFAGTAIAQGQEFAMNESHVEVFNNNATLIYAKMITTSSTGGTSSAKIDEIISYND